MQQQVVNYAKKILGNFFFFFNQMIFAYFWYARTAQNSLLVWQNVLSMGKGTQFSFIKSVQTIILLYNSMFTTVVDVTELGPVYPIQLNTVPCEARGRGFFRRADSFVYISRQGMTSLDLCLQLIPPGQGNQPRRRQPALAGLASPRNHRREAGGHWR